ncbi:hypothetical protein EDC04DRAFT_2606514 [Pisolithus marmoratus]|nr:hypothetical protein EDC04DRAFT_2606514 [Pisolithus marmoratus]
MSHHIFSPEEVQNFLGFDLAADMNDLSAISELVDVSHSLVDDIEEALREFAATVSSEPNHAYPVSPFSLWTPDADDIFHAAFTFDTPCPSALALSPDDVSVPPLSLPPWSTSSGQTSSLTEESNFVFPSPTLPDPLSLPPTPSTPSTPRGRKRKLSTPSPDPSVNKRPRGRQVPVSPDGRPVAALSRDSAEAKDRPFVCPVDTCKKAFGRKEHLERHTVCIHTNFTGWTCTYDPNCTKTFPRKDNYKRHVMRDHPSATWNILRTGVSYHNRLLIRIETVNVVQWSSHPLSVWFTEILDQTRISVMKLDLCRVMSERYNNCGSSAESLSSPNCRDLFTLFSRRASCDKAGVLAVPARHGEVQVDADVHLFLGWAKRDAFDDNQHYEQAEDRSSSLQFQAQLRRHRLANEYFNVHDGLRALVFGNWPSSLCTLHAHE